MVSSIPDQGPEVMEGQLVSLHGNIVVVFFLVEMLNCLKIVFGMMCRVESSNPGNTLYVTGLSTRVTERDLEKHFSKEGKVIYMNLTLYLFIYFIVSLFVLHVISHC